MDWNSLLTLMALIVAGVAVWNAHAAMERVKRLEDLTNNRLPEVKYDPTFTRQPEKR